MFNSQATPTLPPDILQGVRDAALFYPCSGNDLEVPIKLFASAVSAFYFVDIRTPRRPQSPDIKQVRQQHSGIQRTQTFVHVPSGRHFDVHRRTQRAETCLEDLPPLGVFFFRGDHLVDGEGSSNVPWLGDNLLSRVLDLLIPGGLIVTDGSNCDPSGPNQLSAFYHHKNIGRGAVAAAERFEYRGRQFTCIDYVGEKNGPTLVWRVE